MSRVKRAIFKVHSYTGLITGVALLLIGLSGSILVFNEEIDHALYPHLFKVTPSGEAMSLDSAYHIIQAKFTDMDYVDFDELPQHRDDTYRFFMMKGQVQYKAFLNPYTGEIIYSGERYHQWMDWLLLFHYTFTIPVWGDLAIALLSLALLLSCITGVIVYRKHLLKALTFRVAFNFKNWRTSSSSLHRIIGVWSLIFNLMIAATGFWMMRYAFTDTNFNSDKIIYRNVPFNFSIDNTLRRVRNEYPQFQPISLSLATSRDEPNRIYGYCGTRSFFFGDYNDEVIFTANSIKTNFLTQKSFSEKLEGIVFPIHAGIYGNTFIKIIYCISGLTPGLLGVTGFFLWWRRKRKR